MIGSVRKRGKTWSYRIDFGKTYDGKRNQIEKGGYKTKKEADKALNDALFTVNNDGDYVENQKIKFSVVYTEFIETEAKATRAYATLKRYDSMYRNHYKRHMIIPAIEENIDMDGDMVQIPKKCPHCGEPTVIKEKNKDGVNNGDMGIIKSIYTNEDKEKHAIIEFSDGIVKDYSLQELDIIDLAYSTTIHKSQGGEFSTCTKSCHNKEKRFWICCKTKLLLRRKSDIHR